MKKIFVLMLVLGIVGGGYAGQKKHPIHLKVEALIDAAQGTEGQIQALEKGLALWENEMNRVYKEVSRAVSRSGRLQEHLVASQKAWLKFCETEYLYIEEAYGHQGGGILSRQMRLHDRLQIVRARAIELGNRLLLSQDMALGVDP